MAGNIYDVIREENIKKYGTDVNRYGRLLLADLYRNRTHFIYELLQNAEDAYERSRKAGRSGKSEVAFYLFPERLEFRHYGIPFDETDVRGICGIVEGTKSDDPSQIGKFGIGFKSVYAHTDSPEVYSDDKAFCIRNYVHPFDLPRKSNVKEGETLFIIPFGADEATRRATFSEIAAGLENMGLITLLFLRNVSSIEWKTSNGEEGCYIRDTNEVVEHVRKVHLLSQVKFNGGNREAEELWLVIERPIVDNGREFRVEVGFQLEVTKDNRDTIVPVIRPKLAAFFPTEKDTGLKFVIQAPYQTTPSRDSIHENQWNFGLIRETAHLVAESIAKVKSLGLLNVRFLNTLPLELGKLDPLLKPIFDSVKSQLSSNEALLPAYGGGHISAAQALLSRGKELRDLLSKDQLRRLFNRSEWLDEGITRETMPELRQYLTSSLGIPEIDFERFASVLDEAFLSYQTDQWMQTFYISLLEQKALWRSKTYSSDTEGLLRSKPVIRLEKGTHTRPFDLKGTPQAYLPQPGLEVYFPTVKKEVAQDEKAVEFLRALGLREPDKIDAIIRGILPKYGSTEVDVENNKNHVRLIVETARDLPQGRRRIDLLQAVNETACLCARNGAGSLKEYKRPNQVYLGSPYVEVDDKEVFFEGNADIWFLDSRYVDFGDARTLKELGCKDEIAVVCRQPDWQGNVVIHSDWGWHERGLDGFDPDCHIKGLKHALQNPTVEKSRIIWNIVKRRWRTIEGDVETARRQDFSNKSVETRFSTMGQLLRDRPWLPDADGAFHKPHEIMLSQLHGSLESQSPEARLTAMKLELKTDVEEQLLAQLPPEKRRRFEMVDKLFQIIPEERVVSIIERFIQENLPREERLPPEDLAKKVEESLRTEGPQEETPGGPADRWTGLTPDEEETIRKEYGSGFSELLKRLRIEPKSRIEIGARIIGGIDPKEFLFEQYGGNCQICNTRLDLGPASRPHFEVLRLVETRGKNPWTNMEFNVICTCPNCHALLKHGGRDLTQVMVMARNLSENAIAPEPVPERNGDYYVVNITIAGKPGQLFYSPTHMNKIAAFMNPGGETSI